MKHFLFGMAFFATAVASAQTVESRLQRAWERFESDSQLRAGIASIYVADAQTGAVVFERNSRIGLAPASSQKVITAATAYDLLGKDFRYKTQLQYEGILRHDSLFGDLVITGSGDPSFGSWRFQQANPDSILTRMSKAVRAASIRWYNGRATNMRGWSEEAIPDGWIWQDIGQYYGAGAFVLNWHENQFDLYTQPGDRPGVPVEILRSEPDPGQPVSSQASTGAKGSGDNSYLYPSIGGGETFEAGMTLRGTLPPGGVYKVSGALPDPVSTFWNGFEKSLSSCGVQGFAINAPRRPSAAQSAQLIYVHQSPSLDSLIFWFLRKSLNLYGEAFIKTIAVRESGSAETKAGTDLLRTFWKVRGIDPVELRIKDGSGLSPENRVTTRAQGQVLQYARKQSWFPGFYLALPEYNGMKLKSGTIGGVKAYCGYHTSKAGVTYTVSFIVNNYNGSERELIQKMYAVLNELK
ncbi:D-alanyl-D-alanine carboxypeptidase/D-alanyl-D-alanine endopeptidase [Flaviaesturariibacter aridisoli]|uniref:D-alanyl-D-alanine carboxypeptidase/D-alanyl-D-alanine-endopeptidase n=1 Tax=Flaviaesturariibacter aridisoli TaxID=2545761 RepID=A0A4R4DSN7_9BACT|nr:D-alanyl-D-alanine carboxypeptidase/D-alanyl-D-alanine-endopeptidase [Flaviaesturariibacter aridisoli]TCZ65676.1 D-alanyl-D-alanine carboxypeptidase/D-alanyl-D-alanine-endopeptidase [Flaviaesturariibacter aridisoli]